MSGLNEKYSSVFCSITKWNIDSCGLWLYTQKVDNCWKNALAYSVAAAAVLKRIFYELTL
jgi:hypothetical protein